MADDPSTTATPPTGELIGTPIKIIFSALLDNQERGAYVVAVVRGSAPDRIEYRVAGNDYDEVIRVNGPTLRFYGKSSTHHQYGDQFAFTAVTLHLPADMRGTIKYLEVTCDGIGQTRARNLWNKYGPDTVRVLRETPERCVADGILFRELADDCAFRLRHLARYESTTIDLWSILDGKGFPRVLVRECLDRWSVRAATIVRRDPFRLMTARLSGCGFVRCDRLWLDLGKNPAALKRQVLAAVHAINEDRSGNTWHCADEICRGIRQRLGDDVPINPQRAIVAGTRAPARYFAIREDGRGEKWIALARHARNEAVVGGAVCRLLMRGKGKTTQANDIDPIDEDHGDWIEDYEEWMETQQ